MSLHGKNLIAGQLSSEGSKSFRVFSPAIGGSIEPDLHEATPAEVDRAMAAAAQSFAALRKVTPDTTAAFLEKIALEIEALGQPLIDRAVAESGLLPDRLTGERARTMGQLRMFAGLLREGSWVDARIDRALPDRKPLPKPDIRRMLVPIGPIVVFCATNFPLAFSVAGGDTASAFAAGCPVVVKANRAHAGTAEMVGMAVQRAAASCGIPPGAFSLIQGANHEINQLLVKHPEARAVGFTGSLRGGRELFDAAMRRPDPIPVYAEMGSVNPVFILPGALRDRAEAIAEGLKASFTLGNGQFCTKPGMVFGLDGAELSKFARRLAELTAAQGPGTMLHHGILKGYEEGVVALSSVPGVQLAAQGSSAPDPKKTQARASFFMTDSATFLREHRLSEEVFGPSTLVVRCGSRSDLESIAAGLDGHLTGTIHGTEADLKEYASLVSILETKVGRLVFNSFPTGVEVCPSMNHGGPWPAASFSSHTSVGTAAIARWARPVAYQGFPQDALPFELRNRNTRKLWRTVDGKLTQDDA